MRLCMLGGLEARISRGMYDKSSMHSSTASLEGRREGGRDGERERGREGEGERGREGSLAPCAKTTMQREYCIK